MCNVPHMPLAHYVAYNGQHLLAFAMCDAQPDRNMIVDLVVFTNMINTAGRKNFGQQFHQDVQYSEENLPGTWHFIEVDKQEK